MQSPYSEPELSPTFTHQQPLQYSLTCTLMNPPTSQNLLCSQQNASETGTSLSLHLIVPTDTFPKVYELTLDELSLSVECRIIFGNVLSLYKAMKDKNNLEVIYNWGIVRVKYSVVFAANTNKKYVEIKMNRCLENELEEIRGILGQKVQGNGDFQMVNNRIDRVWKRMQENQKIFLKFKQQLQFRIEQLGERLQIQSTRSTILREDISKQITSFDKLSLILCPIFSKVNMNSDYTNNFILQDRKIMYIGQNGTWTQILFKNQLALYKKYEIGFKIVNSKRCNVVAGITALYQAGWRSTIGRGDKETKQGKQRKFIGLSGLGHVYSSQNQVTELKNILLSQHHQSQKQKQASRDKQQKSNNQITLSSPVPTSMKNSMIGSKHHLSSEPHHSPSGSTFKPMQIIKLCIELEKEKIYWKNGSKVLMECKIGPEFKNEALVPYFQFCDTGDSVEFVDL